MNPFQQQQKFMVACGQTVNRMNIEQFCLYWDLVDEEISEFDRACDRVLHRLGMERPDAEMIEQTTEIIDGALDTIVVLVGALASIGVDIEAAWNEVIRSNFAKIDPATGVVRKRDDGKVLKPEGWTPPNLRPFAERALGLTQGEKHDPV